MLNRYNYNRKEANKNTQKKVLHMDKHRKRETDTEKQVLSACKVKRYIAVKRYIED